MSAKITNFSDIYPAIPGLSPEAQAELEALDAIAAEIFPEIAGDLEIPEFQSDSEEDKVILERQQKAIEAFAQVPEEFWKLT